MSIHKSLVLQSRLKRHRNVMSRAERIKKLEQDEKLQDRESVFGLPKLRLILQKAKKKAAAKPAAATGAPAAEGVAATAAAPAPGAAAAKPAEAPKKPEAAKKPQAAKKGKEGR